MDEKGLFSEAPTRLFCAHGNSRRVNRHARKENGLALRL
jgi:hypothetical protein